MKILLLSDLHIGESRESSSHPGIIRQANNEALGDLRSLTQFFNDQNYDLVFQMGDIVREKGAKDLDIKNYESVLSTLSELKYSIIGLLGNHELNTFSYEELSKLYKKYNCGGNFYGSKEINNYQLIWIDHQIDKDGVQFLSQERINWLKNTINKHSKTIIFSHYSIIPRNPKGNFYFEKDELTIRYKNSEEITNLLEDSNVKLAINAHEHWISIKERNGVKYVAVPSFSENIAGQKHSNNNPAIYTVLETDNENITIKSYSGDYCFFSLEI